jgi:membrane protein DedA with SNARE-associated domain
MLDSLFHTWFRHCVVLFLLTFVQEDAAIVAAAFSKVEYGLPFGWALLSVYAGMVAGDLFIFGLGHMAQRNNWLKSKIIGPKVDQVKGWLENNFVKVVAVCRFTPGLLFPTFVACGWFKFPFKRFLIISLVTAGLYTPLVMVLVLILGDVVLKGLGYWAWGALFLVFILFAVVKSIKLLHKSKNDGQTKRLIIPFFEYQGHENGRKRQHKGMPSLAGLKRVVAQAERIPDWLFYIPVGLRWLLLSARYGSLTLPSITNPLIETGGFWGESKSDIMNSVCNGQQGWLAKFVTFKRENKDLKTDVERAIELIKNEGIEFPFVVKPDIGWQGFGVRQLKDVNELSDYLSGYPLHEKVIFQRLITYDGEAGVFYARLPNEPTGKVFSLTLRYFPFVTGDGKSTLRQLIQKSPRTGFKARYYLGGHPQHKGLSAEQLNLVPAEGEMVRLAFIGSIRIGGIYRDARHLISPELSERFDAIAKSIPEFYYGRFDIRFDTTDKLAEGKDFYVFEINGSGSEPIHAWDPEVPFFKVYSELFKTQKLMFRIAACNKKRGFKPTTPRRFLRAFSHQSRLLKSYPRSE